MSFTIKRLVDCLTFIADKHKAWDSEVDVMTETETLQIQLLVNDVAFSAKTRRAVVMHERHPCPHPTTLPE